MATLYLDPFKNARNVSDVRKVYEQQSTILHPDKHPLRKNYYTRRFQELTASYDEAMKRVSDPVYRAAEGLKRYEKETAREQQQRVLARMRRIRLSAALGAAAAEAEAARAADVEATLAAAAAYAAREAEKQTPEYKAAQAAKLDATTRLFAARRREVVASVHMAIVVDADLSPRRAKPGVHSKPTPGVRARLLKKCL